ncbi:HAD family hydrolase, partial [Enterococcus faecium]|nr:HAD family hydrolase [Enterococcus faecium]
MAILILLFTKNLRLAITILVLACPGALVIGAPVSNVAGIGRGAKAGILIKGGDVIDQLAQVDTILFDKTGTVTEGRPTVKSIKEYQEDHWLALAADLEKQTNHPLARSIVEYYEKRGQKTTADFNLPITTIKGIGIKSEYQGQTIWIGSRRVLTENQIELTAQQSRDLQAIENDGQSVVLMTVDQKLVLMVGLVDQVRKG